MAKCRSEEVLSHAKTLVIELCHGLENPAECFYRSPSLGNSESSSWNICSKRSEGFPRPLPQILAGPMVSIFSPVLASFLSCWLIQVYYCRICSLRTYLVLEHVILQELFTDFPLFFLILMKIQRIIFSD